MNIKYINHSIGFFVTNAQGESWIELNEDLKKYPELHDKVLQHELEHATGKSMDFWHEVKDALDYKKQFELLKFSMKHPRAFQAFNPFPQGATNWFMLLCWLVLFGASSLLLWLVVK